ncbi:hypothetical protein BMETH_2618_0 [methanotrophic bacterial endosymbiont of Bathymodiolus sp.]|nr:hypothetical protein BMETH_2618_0 [methanotrophic bacterial endosymbiont of Bathymodiolus sp.]
MPPLLKPYLLLFPPPDKPRSLRPAPGNMLKSWCVQDNAYKYLLTNLSEQKKAGDICSQV